MSLRPHIAYDYRELISRSTEQSLESPHTHNAKSKVNLIPDEFISRPSVVGIGNFDGVHLGHQRLIQAVTEASRHTSGPSIPSSSMPMTRRASILTFDPHPTRLFRGDQGPRLIYSPSDRASILAQLGIEFVLLQHFDRSFAALSPSAFVKYVLVDALRACHVVVGHNFSFGAKRAGQTEDLIKLCATHGVVVEVVEAQRRDERDLSSTWARELLISGQVAAARALLGRPYHVRGVVRRGHQRGRELGFPTANLELESEICPEPSVYAGWLDWGEGPRAAVISVGNNPTFSDDHTLVTRQQWSVEAHILSQPKDPAWFDLYDLPVTLWFTQHIRHVQRFESPETLRAQISRDCDATRAVLKDELSPL